MLLGLLGLLGLLRLLRLIGLLRCRPSSMMLPTIGLSLNGASTCATELGIVRKHAMACWTDQFLPSFTKTRSMTMGPIRGPCMRRPAPAKRARMFVAIAPSNRSVRIGEQ